MTKKEPTQVVHVRLPESQIKALSVLAEQNMGSTGQEVRKAVKKHLEPYPELYPVKKVKED